MGVAKVRGKAGRGKAGRGKANGAGIAADPTLTSAWSLLFLAGLSAGRPSRLIRQRTWRPMSGPLAARPEGLACRRLPHRRSRRHPAWWSFRRPRAGRMVRRERPAGFSAGPRPRSRMAGKGGRSSGSEVPFLQTLPAGLATFTSTQLSRSPRASRLAFDRGLLHAVSQTARGQTPTRSSVWKTSGIQCLAALPFRSLPSRRQLQIAPGTGLSQAVQERLIHFCPIHLWSAVDNSTVHRI